MRRIFFELMDPNDAVEEEDSGRHTRHIPQGYCRLIHQLICETQLGKAWHAYEAERRMFYATKVMDAFIEEIKPFNREGPGAGWRSKVLTPILQRQALGISDVYSWSVNRGIMVAGHEEGDPPVPDAAEDDEEFTDDTDDDLAEDQEYSTEEIVARRRELRPRPTILHATRAYLEFDPVADLEVSRKMYRRNLLYVREMRWHLAVVSENNAHNSTQGHFFNMTVDNQNVLEEYLDTAGVRGDLPDQLMLAEALVIVIEGLERFYWPELRQMVRCNPSLPFAI